jgi:hypothetical protein
MKVISNQKLINRNQWWTKTTFYLSMSILIFGIIFSFTAKLVSYGNLIFILIILAGGYIMLRVNGILSARWGTSPRPDEILSSALKGLPNDFTLFLFIKDLSYVLLGPNGAWILEPYNTTSKVIYDKSRNKWRIQKQGSFIKRLFNSELFSDPNKDVHFFKSVWETVHSKLVEHGESLTPQYILVFTNPEVLLETLESPYPTIKIDKLKEYIRKKPDLNPVQQNVVEKLQTELSK